MGRASRATLVRPRAQSAEGAGQQTALQRLSVDGMGKEDKRLWLESARLLSITGTCRLSMPSVMSGLRCRISFVGAHFIILLVIFCHAFYLVRRFFQVLEKRIIPLQR